MKKARHIIIMAIVIAFATVAYAGFQFTKQQSDFFKEYAAKISERSEHNPHMDGAELIRVAAMKHPKQRDWVIKYFTKFPEYIGLAIDILAESGKLDLTESHWETLIDKVKLHQETFAKRPTDLIKVYEKVMRADDNGKAAAIGERDKLYTELFGKADISQKRALAIQFYIRWRDKVKERAGITDKQFHDLYVAYLAQFLEKFKDKGMPADAKPPMM